MRKLSEREFSRFSLSTRNAIERLLYNPRKYLDMFNHLEEEEFAQQVRMEITSLTTLCKKFDLDFWLLSYDDEQFIKNLFVHYPMFNKALYYSAQMKRKANELIIASPQLYIPEGLFPKSAKQGVREKLGTATNGTAVHF